LKTIYLAEVNLSFVVILIERQTKINSAASDVNTLDK